MISHFNLDSLVGKKVSIDLLAKHKLNIIYVGRLAFESLCKSAGILYGSKFKVGEVTIALNDLLEPAAMITFDPKLIEIIKELDSNG